MQPRSSQTNNLRPVRCVTDCVTPLFRSSTDTYEGKGRSIGRASSSCELGHTRCVLHPDDVAVIQAADQRRVVRREARVTQLAHVGIHAGAREEGAVVERDGLAPDPARTDTVETREEAGAASLERSDG